MARKPVPSIPPSQIRDLRRLLGLSQREFAETMGVTFTSVSRWENGHTSPPRGKRLLMLELEASPPQVTLYVIMDGPDVISAWPEEKTALGIAAEYGLEKSVRRGTLVFRKGDAHDLTVI